MPASQILAFGTGVGANVASQAAYNAASWRSTGFPSGIARSEDLNKVWRQSAFVSAGLAQAVVDLAGVDVLDDGDLDQFVGDLKAAILAGGAALTLTGINTAISAGSAPVIGRTPAAGGSGYASFRLPHGVAPTTNLTNGDLWSTTAGVFARINGASVQLATTATYTATNGITLNGSIFVLSDMNPGTVKGRQVGGVAGAPSDLTGPQLNFLLGFTGTIVMRANTTLHTDTELLCNGAAVSRATYANLFSVIGTTWGVGDGSTTFNLPDLRGKFMRAYDASAGIDPARVFAASQAGSVEAHTHPARWATSPGSANDHNAPGNMMTDDGGGDTNTTTILANTGTTETRPVNQTFYPCIKI